MKFKTIKELEQEKKHGLFWWLQMIVALLQTIMSNLKTNQNGEC